MVKTKLTKAQQWARERFLTKGHLTLARDNFEHMILQKSTLPSEMRALTLAVNHLQELLKDFDKNSKESKKQFMKVGE